DPLVRRARVRLVYALRAGERIGDVHAPGPCRGACDAGGHGSVDLGADSGPRGLCRVAIRAGGVVVPTTGLGPFSGPGAGGRRGSHATGMDRRGAGMAGLTPGSIATVMRHGPGIDGGPPAGACAPLTGCGPTIRPEPRIFLT